MSSKINRVYLVVDDYTPDAGSTIYGAYATHKLAEEMIEHLCDPNNEYGEDMGKNCDIRAEEVVHE